MEPHLSGKRYQLLVVEHDEQLYLVRCSVQERHVQVVEILLSKGASLLEKV